MLWNWKLTLIGSSDISLVTMSSIPLPLHKGNTNWLQFASIGFAPISDRRMRPSPAETSLWQTDLEESIGYSWNMGLLWRLRLWLESMGVGRIRVNNSSSYNDLHQGGNAHDISTFPLHTPISIHPLCKFILALYSKKSSNICPVLNFCCAFCRSFFLSA